MDGEVETGVGERKLELSGCLQSYSALKQQPPPPTPFSPPTHAGMQAVTRCDLAVNELVLDTKVSM